MGRMNKYKRLLTFTTEWFAADEVWLARVTEFPGIVTHGQTRKSALMELCDVLDDVLDDLLQDQERETE